MSPNVRKLRLNEKEQNNKSEYRRLIRVWSILVLLTLLALVGNYLGSGKTNAKYVASITGTDSARVACFVSDIHSLTAKENVILSPSVSDWVECYTFTVSNEKDSKTCEVGMDYSMEVVITGPAGVAYTVVSGDNNSCQTLGKNGNVLNLSGGYFPAGVSEAHHYVIKAKWNSGDSVSYKNANIPISVQVTANVVQRD